MRVHTLNDRCRLVGGSKPTVHGRTLISNISVYMYIYSSSLRRKAAMVSHLEDTDFLLRFPIFISGQTLLPESHDY